MCFHENPLVLCYALGNVNGLPVDIHTFTQKFACMHFLSFSVSLFLLTVTLKFPEMHTNGHLQIIIVKIKKKVAVDEKSSFIVCTQFGAQNTGNHTLELPDFKIF